MEPLEEDTVLCLLLVQSVCSSGPGVRVPVGTAAGRGARRATFIVFSSFSWSCDVPFSLRPYLPF